jgi:hypothetical protein
VLGDHAVAVDQPVGGHDEVDGDPLRVAHPNTSRHTITSTRLPRRPDGQIARQQGDADDDRQDQRRDVGCEEPPVGVEVQHDFLSSFRSFRGNGTLGL